MKTFSEDPFKMVKVRIASVDERVEGIGVVGTMV